MTTSEAPATWGRRGAAARRCRLDNMVNREHGGLCDTAWIAPWIGPPPNPASISALHPAPFKHLDNR